MQTQHKSPNTKMGSQARHRNLQEEGGAGYEARRCAEGTDFTSHKILPEISKFEQFVR